MRPWPCVHIVMTPPPEGTARHCQKASKAASVAASVDNLLEDAPDMHSCACLLAAAARESGIWLNFPPCSSHGSKMDDTTMRSAVSLWLRCSLYNPHHCHYHSAAVDAHVTHGLSCRQNEVRHYRHSPLNDESHRALSVRHR